MDMITVFVDASVCMQTKVGGWGCWAVKNGTSITFGNAFKELISDSSDAEVCAVVNALYGLRNRNWFSVTPYVNVQLDSHHALGFLVYAVDAEYYYNPKGGSVMRGSYYPNKGSERAKASVILLRELQKEHGLRFRVTHVKGHSGGGGRQWVNRKVDKLAKKHMRKARKLVEA